MKDIQVRYKPDNAGIVAKNTGRTRVITRIQMYERYVKLPDNLHVYVWWGRLYHGQSKTCL